jgi:hypothetical protein
MASGANDIECDDIGGPSLPVCYCITAEVTEAVSVAAALR